MNEIYEANPDDISFLVTLEKATFRDEDQFSKQNLKHSLKSAKQRIYIIKKDNEKAGAAIIFLYKNTWRIYSFAILPKYQKMHLGRALLLEIINKAKIHNTQKIVLEVRATNKDAIAFYESIGFKTKHLLKDYYGRNEDGFKMELILYTQSERLQNIIVADIHYGFLHGIPSVSVITPEMFINEPRYQNGNFRVFNLCSDYAYQTQGYYVSLFAAARNLRIIPSIATIEDFNDNAIVTSLSEEIHEIIQTTLKPSKELTVTFDITFGRAINPHFTILANTLYKLFPAPFLRVSFTKTKRWNLSDISSFLPRDSDAQFLKESAQDFFAAKKFMSMRFKNYDYDLAILVDESDTAAPSNRTALKQFIKAAQKIGFYTELITKEDYHRLRQFDALFIRTTTNPHDYTYQFSRLAYAEGLVVIDDPWSILRCANKVYFHESMNTNNIKTPPTMFISKATNLDNVLALLGFPLVLKRPDSSASKGVFKVNNFDELQIKLAEMFKDSAIIVAQKFLESTFDWRVGILNNKPLFVSKYFMAKNHWQIYNWQQKGSNATGEVETLLVADAPPKVIALALRAASVMGDGFYGVDIKEYKGQYFVIEVNDNPSIDHGAEDLALGFSLYETIVRDLYERIEKARTVKSRELLPDNF